MAKPRLQAKKTSEIRITGSRLQDRRFRIWKSNPHCAKCGRLVAFPGGFELDHIIPLVLGGPDTEDNCQILCVDFEDQEGCHAKKTREDLRR